MATTISQSQALDLEQRLIALERRVGVDKQKPNGTSTLDDRLSKLKVQLHEKLSKVETKHNNTTTLNNNKENYKTIQKLLKELDPGIALTHQQQPLLYKRQQVLACSDELKQDFGELERLLRLLLKGTKEEKPEPMADKSSVATTKTPSKSSGSKTPQKKDLAQQAKETAEQKLSQQQQQQADPSRTSGETLRLDQVTQAPILTQHYAQVASAAEAKRVEDLAHKFQALHERTTHLQQTLRHLLECYHTTAMAVSEKIVLADETISAKLAAQ